MSNTEDYELRQKLKKDIIKDVANKLIIELKNELRDQDKIVSGAMAESLYYYPDDKVVGSEREGIDNVEYGRHEGYHVPLVPLKNWAMKKFGVDEGQAWGIAKDVEKKIYDEGIPMSRFMKITLERITNG